MDTEMASLLRRVRWCDRGLQLRHLAAVPATVTLLCPSFVLETDSALPVCTTHSPDDYLTGQARHDWPVRRGQHHLRYVPKPACVWPGLACVWPSLTVCGPACPVRSPACLCVAQPALCVAQPVCVAQPALCVEPRLPKAAPCVALCVARPALCMEPSLPCVWSFY